ncbi:MAG TPA: A/G-specific adenine glycosylase [Solimonas sp.]|nr:A/G-specific adenine glycosylase [Solimonas sp.]
MKRFAGRLLDWFDRHGRHDLPWQHPREPYRVWLAEIMLQQTQVATVVPYFERFLARFPSVSELAQAKLDDVLHLWAGLGYYARARNLHRCAQAIVAQHGGEFPRTLEEMQALPGIGRSTAAAILAQAFGQRHAILDGNVRRVLARHGAVEGWTAQPAVQRALWALAEKHLPEARLADYTQAIMDLGATVCLARKPLCTQCPLGADCVALQQDRVAELPSPRPRRARARRTTLMLLLENARGEILLERRPPAGVWGGLWCLPMADAGADWRGVCRTRFGCDAAQATQLPEFRHVFTHFDLDILPLRVRVGSAAAADAATCWTTIGAPPAVGVPAPVRRLLQSLQELPCPEPSTA